MKTKAFLIALTGFVFIIVTYCKKEEPATMTVLSTSEVSGVTGITAVCGGVFASDGRKNLISCGVCWSTDIYPTISDTKTIQFVNSDQFVSSISGLIPGTTYHVRAYATTWAGTAYGSDVIFTTLDAPGATTRGATSVSATGATLYGSVYSSGLQTIVSFEYGKTTSYGQGITAVQSPVTSNESTDVSATISGLTGGNYHFRIKAVNSLGTVYSNDCGFSICSQLPLVETLRVTNMSPTGVTLNGTVNANGASTTVTFEYTLIAGRGGSTWKTVGASESPVTADGITNVSAEISGLNPGSSHYFHVKATNSCGTATGNNLMFTLPLPPVGVPTVSTLAATNMSPAGATLNGTVNANGLSTVVTFEYGTSISYGHDTTACPSPVSGFNNTQVNTVLTDLKTGNYHFRIKAANPLGTVYGSDREFSICSQVPAVTILAATNISPTGVTLNGTVNANGSSTTVTFQYYIRTGRGIIWKTVTADQEPVNGNGITNVSAYITGLNPGSTHSYYVTATNNCGTVTSERMSFTLPGQ